ERQEDLLALGKLSDRLGDEVYALLVEETPERVGMNVILHEIELAGSASEVVEADQRDRSDLRQQRAIGHERETERGGQVVLARGTIEGELEGVRCPFDGGRLLAHAARNPVDFTQVVEDGAADAKLRVRGKQGLPPGLVPRQGIHEAECSPRDEIVEI